MPPTPHVTVIGAGYVGLTTAAAACAQGLSVHLVETSSERVAQIRGGRTPFYEPGLKEALEKALRTQRLTVDTPDATARVAPVALLCVGTPPAASGAADLSFLKEAASWI